MKGPAAKRREGIGFSQRIRLDWLEYTANAVLVGSPEGEIVAALRERLRARFSLGGGRVSGNRDKAASILTRVGVTVPDERRPLRDARRRTGHPHHAIYRTAGCGPPRVSIRDGYLPGRNTPTRRTAIARRRPVRRTRFPRRPTAPPGLAVTVAHPRRRPPVLRSGTWTHPSSPASSSPSSAP